MNQGLGTQWKQDRDSGFPEIQLSWRQKEKLIKIVLQPNSVFSKSITDDINDNIGCSHYLAWKLGGVSPPNSLRLSKRGDEINLYYYNIFFSLTNWPIFLKKKKLQHYFQENTQPFQNIFLFFSVWWYLWIPFSIKNTNTPVALKYFSKDEKF